MSSTVPKAIVNELKNRIRLLSADNERLEGVLSTAQDFMDVLDEQGVIWTDVGTVAAKRIVPAFDALRAALTEAHASRPK